MEPAKRNTSLYECQQGEERISSEHVQQEDAALKVSMQFFADELLPYWGIEGKVVAFAPTELIHLEIQKLFQDFNLVMEDGSWKHFEFQSTNEGIKGLKRFRVYEALTSYQHKVAVTTYVLYSGMIKNPMTEFHEGINSYRVIPLIMREKNADQLIQELKEKVERQEVLTKQDLIPLILCPLMSGKISQLERMKAAYGIVHKADAVDKEDVAKIGAVIYAMADKFLNQVEKEKLMEGIRMTELGRIIMNKAIEERDTEIILKKHAKGVSADVIADFLEISIDKVNMVIQQALNK